MEEKFDPCKEETYICYLDTNNLYGWAMSKKLPVGNFAWMHAKEMLSWRKHPCILEVNLEYPRELHDFHNDYPLAPEKMKLGAVEKLVPNLRNKEKYVVHHENLKLYETLGMKITKIHKGIKFVEDDFMKKYIELRKKAKDAFERLL